MIGTNDKSHLSWHVHIFFPSDSGYCKVQLGSILLTDKTASNDFRQEVYEEITLHASN